MHRLAQRHGIELGSRLDQQPPQLKEILSPRTGISPGKPDGSERFRLDERDQIKRASTRLNRQTDLGQQRDAISGCHHLNDRRQARGTKRVDGVELRQAAVAQRLIAQAMAFLKQQQPLTGDHISIRAHPTRQLAQQEAPG